MSRVFVDATTLVALGQVGELQLLDSFEGRLVIPDSVHAEVTAEPARTNLDRFLDENQVVGGPVDTDWHAEAMQALGASARTSDTDLIEGVLAAIEDRRAAPADETPPVGLIADDRRLRTVAEGLGATVTGTFGVVVRAAAVDRYFSATQAKRVVRRIDSHGMHLTGEMREQAVGATE
jgi:predicted nucleic acid-binding protein